MWQRRTFHECAEELEMVSNQFRSVYTNTSEENQQRRTESLQELSKQGIAILRVLTLSIRPEQDYDQDFKANTEHIPVGALKRSANNIEVSDVLNNYQPPYNSLHGFEELGLREALNKIAHVDPSQTDFFANENFHDLILVGQDKRARIWIAIVSIVELCRVIKSLPDQSTEHSV